MSGFSIGNFFGSRVLLIGFVFFFLIAFCKGQQVPAAVQSGPWLSGSYSGAGVSFYAKNLTSGKVLLDYNSKLTLIPASSLKAVTIAAATETISPQEVFQTTLEIHGEIKGSTLHGDVVIRGNGDPAIGSRYSDFSAEALLLRWTEKLQQTGIKHITGTVIADASCCSNQLVPDTWPWYDIGNYYASGAGCINWRDNSYNLHFDRRRSAAGTEVIITGTDPYVPNLQHQHHIIASGNRDLAYIYGAPGQFERTVRGSIPAGNGVFTIRGSLPNPALQLAFELHQAIVNCGIEVGNYYRVQSEPSNASKIQILDRLAGHERGFYFERTMAESDNLFAEAILNKAATALKSNCAPGASAEAMSKFWQNKSIPDADKNFMLDGSGLSPRNGVSSGFLVGILEWMHQHSDNFPIYLSSFPVAGRDGTVRNWMRNKPSGSTVYAKSGSMTRVQSYAGYVVQADGSMIAFSLIVNNFTGFNNPVRRDMEGLLMDLIR